MSETVDKQQMKNILIPAAAIAAIILVIGLIISGTSGGGSEAKSTAKAANPEQVSIISKVMDNSDKGMSDVIPPLDSSEWKDIGGGLKIWDIKDGEGDMVKSGQTVNCHYSGWLLNGTVFDSSRTRGAPIEFSLNGVIQGWTRGIPGMKPGGIRRLYIPYILAYGEPGNPPKIPAKADLVFEVKLISAK